MWLDYYLKANSQEEFEAACPWMGEDGVVMCDGPRHALEVIGPLVYGGQYDVDGTQLQAPTVIAGWHVNVRLPEGVALPPALLPFEVAAPAYPKRVFAG